MRARDGTHGLRADGAFKASSVRARDGIVGLSLTQVRRKLERPRRRRPGRIACLRIAMGREKGRAGLDPAARGPRRDGASLGHLLHGPQEAGRDAEDKVPALRAEPTRRLLGEKGAFMGVLSGEFGRDRIGLGRTGVDRG